MNTGDDKLKLKQYKPEDLTGRSRLASNVVFSWLGYLVVIISGFIMPRFINEHVGQTLLGIWDFAWSIVHYLSVQSMGVGSSVNRYVAKYRAKSDMNGLRIAVSSVIVIQVIIAIWVTLSTLIVCWLLPYFFSERLGEHTEIAQWIIGFLGGSVAIQMGFDASRGIMTGCHRWDLYNIINAVSRATTVIAMMAALFFGGGLKSLGILYFFITFLTEISRMIISLRICPEFKFRLKYVSLSQSKRMLLFGFKTVIASMPPFVLIQTINIFLVGFSGPAALAIFSRCTALVRHIETLVNKFAFILTPTAGSLQSTGQLEDLRAFFKETTKYGAAITLPLLLFLVVDGDLLLTIWMGPNYAEGLVLTILAAGYLLPISQSSVMRILIGMNLHGKIGLISLAVNVCALVLGISIVSYLGWDLLKSAIIVAIPLTIGNGLIIPFYACQKLRISLYDYVSNSFTAPILCNVPYLICILLIRQMFNSSNWNIIIASLVAGGLVLIPLYFIFVLEKKARKKMTGIIGKRVRSH